MPLPRHAVIHSDCHSLRIRSCAVTAGNRDGINPSCAGTRSLSPQPYVVSIHNFPIRLSIAIAGAIDWLVAGYAEATSCATNIVTNQHVPHFVVRWPQRGWAYRGVLDIRGWERLASNGLCCDCQRPATCEGAHVSGSLINKVQTPHTVRIYAVENRGESRRARRCW